MATLKPRPAKPVRLEITPVDFVKEFEAMTLAGAEFAKRPGYGKLGTPLNLVANVYPVTIRKGGEQVAHQYDVQMLGVARLGTPQATGAAATAQERQLPLKVCRAIFNALSDNLELAPYLAKAAYDGRKSVFLPCLLPCGMGTETYKAELPPNTDNPDAAPRAFTVKFAHAQRIDLSVLARYATDPSLKQAVAVAIQAIDVLLRHDPSHKAGIIVAGQGRKFLNTTNGITLPQGAQILKGFFQSIRPSALGPVLNLDTASSPYIRNGSLLTVCNMIVGRDGGGGGGGGRGRGAPRGGRGGGGNQGGRELGAFNPSELKELKSKLKGGRVRVTHRVDRKEYIIDGFGLLSSEQMVSISDKSSTRPVGPSAIQAAQAAAEERQLALARPPAPETRMTLDKFFHQTYNVRPATPSVQCIRLKNGNFLPIQVLELLPGLSIPPTRLTRDQAADMIKQTATVPSVRRDNINRVRIENNFEENSRLKAWNLEISASMATLTGRQLPPPKVTYAPTSKKPTPNVNAGSWNLTDSKFLGPNKPLEHWAVINFAPYMIRREQLQVFTTTLIAQCRARGMTIRNERPAMIEGNGNDLLGSLRSGARAVMDPQTAANKQPPQLLVLILGDPKMYPDLKRLATFSLPVPIITQVLLAKNLTKERGVDQYCGNVSLKLNVKLFGYNSIVSPADVPKVTTKTILFGADTSHPPSSGSSVPAPSIAAVVATRDSKNITYECQVREQEGRKEMITDLKSMSIALLKGWIERSKVKPDVILFFRDGVSEGQYATVVYDEIASLKAAVKEIDPKWVPKITYVICGKRHNMRFFAANQQTPVDRTGNLPPGTVVDTTVTNPYLFDFYLQAHAGLIGTARPTHYVVLLDENGFTADAMQKLCNSLCYTFARATRSVSLIPPAYYADIVAEKARSFVYFDDDTSSNVSGGENFDPMRIQNRLDLGGPKPMWFM